MPLRQLAPTQSVETFQTRNGLGGLFTVSIEHDRGDGVVDVRVHYPTKDWDGFRFTTTRDRLHPTGKWAKLPVAA